MADTFFCSTISFWIELGILTWLLKNKVEGGIADSDSSLDVDRYFCIPLPILEHQFSFDAVIVGAFPGTFHVFCVIFARYLACGTIVACDLDVHEMVVAVFTLFDLFFSKANLTRAIIINNVDGSLRM